MSQQHSQQHPLDQIEKQLSLWQRDIRPDLFIDNDDNNDNIDDNIDDDDVDDVDEDGEGSDDACVACDVIDGDMYTG